SNFSIQCRASSSVAKPREGHCGQYFNVRNNDSENGLSLLTRGRLCDGVLPSSSNLALSVLDVIGAPLSACSTSGLCRHCSRKTARWINVDASSPDSQECTSHATSLRLYTSRIAYRNQYRP